MHHVSSLILHIHQQILLVYPAGAEPVNERREIEREREREGVGGKLKDILLADFM